MRHAVVIGAGLGGIAVALRLRAKGWRVTVCEQGETAGGKLNVWRPEGFHFDTGPSLITMPWIFRELYETAGARMEDHLDLRPLDPLARYIFADGLTFHCTSSLPAWLGTLNRIDPRERDGFLRFLNLGARLYAVSSETFLRRAPRDWASIRGAGALRHMPLRYGWGNYAETVDAHFVTPYLRQLYNRYPTYVGSSPYASPATLAVIPYIEFAYGGWYPMGGLYRIVESLTELGQRNGIEFRMRARVERIETAGGRVTGVELADGAHLPASLVVMNGDASLAAGMLGGSDGPLPEQDRSMSGFVLNIALRRELPEIDHHNIYFSSDYRREFSEIFDQRRFPSDPTVYVNCASRTDRSVVPDGRGETLFVMANAPASDRAPWDRAAVASARAAVFSRLRKSGFPDVEADIVAEQVWTPARIGSRYSMPGGAIYGAHSHGWQNAFLRPSNKDPRVGGLYYAGGSTHPGGGTPTVLLSAEITANLIERYETA